MAKGRIDSLMDLEAIRKEILTAQQDMFKFLDGLEAKLESMGGSKVNIGGANNFKELNTATKEYNAYVKQAESLIKQLADTEAKLVVVRQKESVVLAENKLRLQQLTKEQKDRVKLAQAESGSIAELSLKYDKAYRIYKQLSDVQRDSSRGQALNKFLADTNAQLKQLEGSVGQFQRNVGNYAGSLAKPFETLINKLEELKANLKNGIGIGGGTDVKSLQGASFAIEAIDKALNKASASNSTSVTQARALGNAYKDLSITLGKTASDTTFLSTLKAEVGEAKDSVDDLNDELKLAASDTKGIDNVVGSLNALAGIAQGAAGAYALLGASEEDAAVITSKLIAVQGIANSIQQVGTELTRKGSFANGVYASIQNLVAVSMDRTAAASVRLAAAGKLLLTTFVVIGLIVLVAELVKYARANDEAAKSVKDLEDVRKEGLKNSAEELTKSKLLYEASQNQSLSLKDRKKAVDELQKQYPSYFKNLTDEEILTGKAASAYDSLAKNIIKTGLAQAAKARITEISSAILDDVLKVEEANKRIQNIVDGGVAVQNKFRPKTLASGNVINTAPITFSIDQKDKDAAISAIKTTYAEAFAVVDAGNARIQKIIEGVGAANLLDGIIGDPDKAKETTDKVKKITDNTAADILKSNFELGKLTIQQEVDKSREIFANEKEVFADRLDALKAFTFAQISLINLEKQFELDQEDAKLKEILAGLEAQKKEKGANVIAIKKQEAKEIDASNKRIEVIEAKSFDNLIKAGKAYTKELKDLKKERQDIRDEERQQIEDYEAWTRAQEKKLIDMLVVVNKGKGKVDDDDIKAKIVKYTAMYKELSDMITSFFIQGIDAELAAIDAKQKLQDADTAKRINQINLLGLSEKERIVKIAQIEKQALHETEQNEKRRRKLAYERAKFEKLASIASIIANTAQAVVKVLKDYPYPINIAFAAIVGAIGALQLARAIATPLPQYKKGTSSAKKGLALVSEEGQELVNRGGQLFLTPKQPTLMEMAGGEQITPAHLTRDIINSINFSKSFAGNGMAALNANGMSRDQGDTMISELRDLKKETSRSRIVMHMHPGIEWDAYIQRHTR